VAAWTPAASERFGAALALAGTRALVGAPRELNGRGATYAYDVAGVGTLRCACTASPCGNVDAVAGCFNSSGLSVRLAGCGSSSVAADDLELSIARAPAGEFAALVMGAPAGPTPFGNGQACLATGSARSILDVRLVGADGRARFGPGLVARSQGLGAAGPIAVGSSWTFQVWYRDPGGPCGAAANASDARDFVFAP